MLNKWWVTEQFILTFLRTIWLPVWTGSLRIGMLKGDILTDFSRARCIQELLVTLIFFFFSFFRAKESRFSFAIIAINAKRKKKKKKKFKAIYLRGNW